MLADADAFKERKQREYSERNPKLAKWYKHKASRFVTAVPVLPE
jgi:hypothetical protein